MLPNADSGALRGYQPGYRCPRCARGARLRRVRAAGSPGPTEEPSAESTRHRLPTGHEYALNAIQAARVATPTRVLAMRLELATSAVAPKLLPKTTPKKPHGIAVINTAWRVCSGVRP